MWFWTCSLRTDLRDIIIIIIMSYVVWQRHGYRMRCDRLIQDMKDRYLYIAREEYFCRSQSVYAALLAG